VASPRQNDVQEPNLNKHLIAIVASVAALQGCANQSSAPQVAGEDLNIGLAKTCTPSKVDVSASTSASGTIAMTNDGWCAIRVVEKDGQPFLLGLVRSRPEHGRVLIQKLGGETRLEYTANPRYVGEDRFTVALRSKTQGAPDTMVQVAVNVSMGEAPIEPVAAAAPATGGAPTAAKRTTTSTRTRSR